jgi:predicted CoA-binding protein
LTCYRSLTEIPGQSLDRVSLYVPPEVGLGLLEEIAAVGPAEVWLNPGSSSSAIRQRARRLGLDIIEGCSIVALGLSPSEFP